MSVVLLAGNGDSTWIVHNALREQFPISAVIIEDAPPAAEVLGRRARKLGWPTVAGQVAFILFARLTKRFSKARQDEILKEHGLSRLRSSAAVTRVDSANSAEVIEMLQALDPRVVVINGTRILSEEVLGCIDAPFINVHAGITPMYRGVHGCYWALANRDPAHAGVTVHLVDSGVDTGEVIAQAVVQPVAADSYHTYPFLQLAAGIPLLEEAIRAALAGQLGTVEVTGESRLYYHPTIWRYAGNRVRLGVR
jgi:phosphoribosylglycinamide formyltransferase-1